MINELNWYEKSWVKSEEADSVRSTRRWTWWRKSMWRWSSSRRSRRNRCSRWRWPCCGACRAKTTCAASSAAARPSTSTTWPWACRARIWPSWGAPSPSSASRWAARYGSARRFSPPYSTFTRSASCIATSSRPTSPWVASRLTAAKSLCSTLASPESIRMRKARFVLLDLRPVFAALCDTPRWMLTRTRYDTNRLTHKKLGNDKIWIKKMSKNSLIKPL